MKLSQMKKEDLELFSYKDITFYILEENSKMNTAELFKKIISLLELPSSTFEQKIGDYYTSLTTDKRFVMLEDGCWDLRSRHTSDKVLKVSDEEDDDDIEEVKDDNILSDEIEEDHYGSGDEDEDDYDDGTDDDLKDLVVMDEDELELEQ